MGLAAGALWSLMALLGAPETPEASVVRPTLVVAPLRALGTAPRDAARLTEDVRTQAVRVGRFTVVSPQDVASIHAELQAQLEAGCDEAQCIAELQLYSWLLLEGWQPEIHPTIRGDEVDFIIRGNGGRQVAIEVDGKKEHERTTEQDKVRDAKLLSAGYRVVRRPPRDVRESPHEFISHIRRELEGEAVPE